MWFRLASAEWETGKHLGAMNVLANAWSVGYNVSGGITKTSGSGSVSKGGTLTATFTLATGATFTNATLTPASAGTVTHTVSSSTVTITIANVSANCTLSVVATSGNTGGGDIPVTPPSDIKTYTITWEAGGLITADGTTNTSDNRRRTAGYIPIEYGYGCMTTLNSDNGVHVVFYDADYNYVAPTSQSNVATITMVANKYVNLLTYKPEKAAYFKIMARSGEATQDNYWLPLQNTGVIIANVTALTWEPGGLNVANGTDNNAADIIPTRRRNVNYIPISYKTINISGGQVEAHAVYYNFVGDYLGTTMQKGTYGFFTVASGETYDITTQAPSGTAFYRIMSRTGDAAQDAYWSISQ